MSVKRRPTPKIAAVASRDAAFQDAVVLVNEPFVLDKRVAMQAINFVKRLFPGSFDEVTKTMTTTGNKIGTVATFIVLATVASTNAACTSLLDQNPNVANPSDSTVSATKVNHGEIRVVNTRKLTPEESNAMVLDLQKALKNAEPPEKVDTD